MIRVRGWYHITKFCYSTPSANVLPEAVYCCLHVYYNVYSYDCGVLIVYTKFCLDWLLHEQVTWPSMSLS